VLGVVGDTTKFKVLVEATRPEEEEGQGGCFIDTCHSNLSLGGTEGF